MRKVSYYRKFKKKLEEFLGVNLKLKWIEGEVNFLPEYKSEFIKNTLNQMVETFNLFDNILDRYYEENRDIYFTDIIEEYTQRMLSYLARGNYDVLEEQKLFIDIMKKESNETYESESAEISILYFKTQVGIEEELKKMELEYLEFKEPKLIEEIFQEKLSLKMLNGDNIVLIIGADFKGYGLGVNKKEKELFKDRFLKSMRKKNTQKLKEFMKHISKEVREELEGYDLKSLGRGKINEEKLRGLVQYANKKMVDGTNFSYSRKDETQDEKYMYMELKNKELKLFIKNSMDNYISYRGGRWKLKSFNILKLLILEKFYMDIFLSNTIKGKEKAGESSQAISSLIDNIDMLVRIIKELLTSGEGGLFIIQNRNLSESERCNMFIDGNRSNSIYRQTVKKEGETKHLLDHNFEYLKLISKVDGAVILDNEFKLISFGRLVRLKLNENHEKVEGGRTAAALNSSKFGIAIKVSEDKEITVWENGEEILKI